MADPSDRPDERTVTVLPDDIEVSARSGQTVLSALVRSGYAYRIGCRRGGCGICKVQLVEGDVRYEKTVAETVLTAAERAAGVCLSCRAVPTTPVVVELQPDDRLRRLFSLPGSTRRPALAGGRAGS
jgi:CDP-4-dehydro-6-deoxyglucose reductase